jgi:hypothetical protein
MEIKIVVKGLESRRVEHVALVGYEGDIGEDIEVALELYRRFYPDAPMFRKTIYIDHA